MNEKEQPIRHQRDPNLSPIPRNYKRTRASAGLLWIPEFETGPTDVFPWLLRETVEPENNTSTINSEFTNAVDETKTISVYGEWQGAESLSAEGRKIVNDILFVFQNLSKQLVETDGEIPEALLFAGLPREQYKQMIDDTIKDKREHRYIMELFDQAFGQALDEFAQTWRKVAAEGPKQKSVTDPHTDPEKRFNQQVISATTAINLAYSTPFDQVKPTQEEPKSPIASNVPSPTQQLINRIESRGFSPSKPERRIPTDIMKDELIAEKLIDPDEDLKPIVIVNMILIRNSVRDPSSKADPLEMIIRVAHDPAINKKDIEALTLFTKHLLGIT